MSVYEINDTGALLASNTYQGRGIIIGETPDKKYAVASYFIMGRSENSRNRVFTEKGEEITIYPYDASKVSDSSLIIYSPVRRIKNQLIVTNGDQTDTVFDYMTLGKTFEDALMTREFEPDKPNFTPRISGMITFEDGAFIYKLSILKSADESGSGCNRYFFNYTSCAGTGHFVHTYNGNGDPLPTFTGEPERVSIEDNIDMFASTIWNNLDPDNKISLYVRYTDVESGKFETRIFNKNGALK